MRKIIIAITSVVILVLLLFLGLPFAMGLLLQNEYPEIIAKVSKTPNLSIKMVQYQRGWFSSEAKIEATVKSKWLSIYEKPETKGQGVALVSNVHIQHGPLVFVKPNGKSGRLVLARALLVSQNETPGLAGHTWTLWTWNNRLRSVFYANDIQLGDGDEAIHLKGLRGRVTMSQDIEKISARINMDSVNLSEKPVGQEKTTDVVELNNLRFVARLHKQGLFWYGERKATADSISVKSDTHPPLQMAGVVGVFRQIQQDEKSNIQLDYSVKNLVANKVNLSNLELVLSMKDLNTQAYSNLIDRLMQIEEESQIHPFSYSALWDPLMKLVGKGLNINIEKLSFNTTDGPVSLSANVALPMQQGEPSIKYVIENSQASSALELPQGWLQNQLVNFYENKKPKDQINQTAQAQQQPLLQQAQAPENQTQLQPSQLQQPQLQQPQQAPQPLQAGQQAPTMAQQTQAPVAATDTVSSEAEAQNDINRWIESNWLVKSGNTLVMKINYKQGQWFVNDKPFSLAQAQPAPSNSVPQQGPMISTNPASPNAALPNPALPASQAAVTNNPAGQQANQETQQTSQSNQSQPAQSAQSASPAQSSVAQPGGQTANTQSSDNKSPANSQPAANASQANSPSQSPNTGGSNASAGQQSAQTGNNSQLGDNGVKTTQPIQ